MPSEAWQMYSCNAPIVSAIIIHVRPITGSGTTAISLLASRQGDPGSIPGRVAPDFRMWKSCRTMPLVGGSSRGSPVSPALSFRRCSILASITLIGSQDLDVKSRPNLFTHSITGSAKLMSSGILLFLVAEHLLSLKTWSDEVAVNGWCYISNEVRSSHFFKDCTSVYYVETDYCAVLPNTLGRGDCVRCNTHLPRFEPLRFLMWHKSNATPQRQINGAWQPPAEEYARCIQVDLKQAVCLLGAPLSPNHRLETRHTDVAGCTQPVSGSIADAPTERNRNSFPAHVAHCGCNGFCECYGFVGIVGIPSAQRNMAANCGTPTRSGRGVATHPHTHTHTHTSIPWLRGTGNTHTHPGQNTSRGERKGKLVQSLSAQYFNLLPSQKAMTKTSTALEESIQPMERWGKKKKIHIHTYPSPFWWARETGLVTPAWHACWQHCRASRHAAEQPGPLNSGAEKSASLDGPGGGKCVVICDVIPRRRGGETPWRTPPPFQPALQTPSGNEGEKMRPPTSLAGSRDSRHPTNPLYILSATGALDETTSAASLHKCTLVSWSVVQTAFDNQRGLCRSASKVKKRESDTGDTNTHA
ncbi:hypothetical protein PR048_003524 [Dryococelus australis]|uniref:Uncharacterized protein n=1 Tax=Dryococelus australis TaxID=614101 RepID=A0ABQ9IPL9_9NEOP|nr:hypothetical protein PR048_003524 [Dryococelus australis]